MGTFPEVYLGQLKRVMATFGTFSPIADKVY